MSAHRPTGRIEVDVFTDASSPEAAATALWETVVRWVNEDVKPVIVVTMEDDVDYTVDLAGARGVCTFCQHEIWHSDSDGWVAPDAGIDRESGDGIWRDCCPDNHTEPGAPHVPEMALAEIPPERQTIEGKWADRRYRHTHASVNDGSPAMKVSQDDDTITLVNEDGHVWTDPINQWRPIEEG